MPLASSDFVSPPNVVGTVTAFFDGKIDLDPASSDTANTFVGADKYFTPKHNGLNVNWQADSVYLYPPRDVLHGSEQPPNKHLYRKARRFKKSAQRIWLEESLVKYKKQEFNEAIIFLTSAEVALLVTQKLDIDFPLCIMNEHPQLRKDTENFEEVKNTKCFGFIYYLPSMTNTDKRICEFYQLFSNVGRVYI